MSQNCPMFDQFWNSLSQSKEEVPFLIKIAISQMTQVSHQFFQKLECERGDWWCQPKKQQT